MIRCFCSIVVEPPFNSQLTLRYVENQMVRRNILLLEYFSVFTWQLVFQLWPIHVAHHAIVLNRHPTVGYWPRSPIIDCNLNASEWCAKRDGMGSKPVHQPSWLRIFCGFLSPSTKMTGMLPKSWPWPLPPSFQSIHYHSVVRLCSLCYRESH
jgi:hypothetical protein